MRCECLGCKNHEKQCLNHEGQLNLFSDEVIRVTTYDGKKICDLCAPKPIASPRSDWFYNKNEAKRLSKQETLFIFE